MKQTPVFPSGMRRLVVVCLKEIESISCIHAVGSPIGAKAIVEEGNGPQMYADSSYAVFVSYRHRTDRAAFDQFQQAIRPPRYLVDGAEVRMRKRPRPELFVRDLVEHYLRPEGTTVVFASPASAHSQLVDWEIAAALTAHHAIIVTRVPWIDASLPLESICPPRALANLQSGYAVQQAWAELLDPARFEEMVELGGSRDRSLIRNDQRLKRRDGRPSLARRLFGA